jgi:hypothetical protein
MAQPWLSAFETHCIFHFVFGAQWYQIDRIYLDSKTTTHSGWIEHSNAYSEWIHQARHKNKAGYTLQITATMYSAQHKSLPFMRLRSKAEIEQQVKSKARRQLRIDHFGQLLDWTYVCMQLRRIWGLKVLAKMLTAAPRLKPTPHFAAQNGDFDVNWGYPAELLKYGSWIFNPVLRNAARCGCKATHKGNFAVSKSRCQQLPRFEPITSPLHDPQLIWTDT